MHRKSLTMTLTTLAFVAAAYSTPVVATEYPVLVNGNPGPGTDFGIGIDDSSHHRHWLKKADDSLKIEYPGNLDWAALFITVDGPAVEPPRPSKDFSKYAKLAVEMKGETGAECVKVGIKDNDDPDDGTEPKKDVEVSKEWKVYKFDVSEFAERHTSSRSPLDMGKLYVVTELVFPCGPDKNEGQTVYVRNIKFLSK